MSRQLFINNANAIPGADTNVVNPADVAEARVALFDVDDFAGGTLDPTSLTSAKRVQIVQGGANENDAIISSIINVDDVVEVVEKDYVAPVAQVTTVTAETGTGFASIVVVRADGSPRPQGRLTAEVKLDGKTAAAIATEFATQLNKQFPDFVTVTTNAADIVITANLNVEGAVANGIVAFDTALDGEASNWTKAATTAAKGGTGTGAQVRALEEVAKGSNYLNRIYLPIAPPFYANTSSNYKLITLKVKTNTTPNIARSNMYQEITIALVTGGTVDGIDLNTFFGV